MSRFVRLAQRPPELEALRRRSVDLYDQLNRATDQVEKDRLQRELDAVHTEWAAASKAHYPSPQPQPPPEPGAAFWRSPSGYRHPSNMTAMDVLNEMTEDGRNDDFMEQALASGLPLDQIPANETVWVARTREQAETYNRDYDEDYDEDDDYQGPPNEDLYSFTPEDYKVIIPDDGDGGMWIWTPGMESQAATKMKIRTAQKRRRTKGDILLQGMYDYYVANYPADHPKVVELRQRVIQRGLDTREQGTLGFPDGDEPWVGENNISLIAQRKVDYIRQVNDRLQSSGGRFSYDERVPVEMLAQKLLSVTDPDLSREIYHQIENKLAELESRPAPTTEAAARSRFIRLSQEEQRIPVFRGVGPRGLTEPRLSDGGVYGPGYYMYNHPLDARSYAAPGGGIIVGTVPSDTQVNDDGVVVVDDLGKLHIVGHVPTENTLDSDEIMRLVREMGVDPGERYRGR